MNAQAANGEYWPEGFLLAGEIIVSPARDEGGASTASSASNRDKARTYRQDAPSSGTTAIILPDDDDEGGMLAPRGGESLPSDRRSRAREYRESPDDAAMPGQVIILPDQILDDRPLGPREQTLKSNRSKARSYMKGEATVGSDGLPLVDCRDVGSTSGRIGDDTQSGSVITIIQNNKQVKVRCR
jgi:hypothetical protein